VAGIAVAVLLAPALAPAQDAVAFKVVVNERIAGGRMTRQVLSDIFLGKATHWEKDVPISPVDQSATAPIRESFSQQVLGQSVMAVKSYWTRQILRGGRPPPVKDSDQDVLRYVRTLPGGIGYVAVDAELPGGVKAIEIQ
jgi:ABC-type phosphate transport system substrate-binding protein